MSSKTTWDLRPSRPCSTPPPRLLCKYRKYSDPQPHPVHYSHDLLAVLATVGSIALLEWVAGRRRYALLATHVIVGSTIFHSILQAPDLLRSLEAINQRGLAMRIYVICRLLGRMRG